MNLEEEPVQINQAPMIPQTAPSVAPAALDERNPLSGKVFEGVIELPPYLVPPTFVTHEESTVHMITVAFRSTGDKTRDVLRLRRIHGIITSYPGNDRFAFHVFERGRGYLLEFPNFTIGYCPELLSRLSGLIGKENVRIDKITFQ
jgi:hypothetical protein